MIDGTMYSTPSKQFAGSSKSFDNRNWLYLMHFGFSSVSRICDISFTLFMSSITVDTLILVSFLGFLSSFFACLFMPSIGSTMDNMKRQNGMRWAMLVKVVCLTSAYGCCIVFSLDSSEIKSFGSMCALYSIPFLVAINGLSSLTISQSLERDWVVVLSSGDSNWLSVTNSVLRQIDLVCLTFANPVTGYLFALTDSTAVSVILMVANIAVCLCFFWFLRYLYKAWPDLSLRETKAVYYSSPIKIKRNTAPTPYHAPDQSILSDFLTSGCAGAMLASSFLSFTCLNFGSLMIVYLQYSGVTAPIVRLCRAAAASVGLLGAFSFPYIARWLGLYPTAQLALHCQAVLSLCAASTFLFSDRRLALFTLVTLVLNAKSWIVDLAVRQIAQETIHESIRGRVNGQWKSLVSFFEMCGFAVGILLPDPEHFWILAVLSAGMVMLSAAFFTLSNPFGGLNYLQWDIPTVEKEDVTATLSGGNTGEYQSIHSGEINGEDGPVSDSLRGAIYYQRVDQTPC